MADIIVMAISFEDIKYYYDRGMWTAEMVRNMVIVGNITPEQYQLITGAVYPNLP